MARRSYLLFGLTAVAAALVFLISHQTVLINNRPPGGAVRTSVGGGAVVGNPSVVATLSAKMKIIAGHNWTVAPDLANYSFPHGKLDLAKAADHSDDFSLFVSVASYRDDQCQPTVEDMYLRAKRPRSLFLGIVEQHQPGDPQCTPPHFKRGAGGCTTDFCFGDNIRVSVIHSKDAKGPTFGRYYGMLMYRGEKYFMMIDSHNRFVTHWDAVVVNMYNSLPVNKGVLSHYPEAWHGPGEKETNAPLDPRMTTTYLCTAKFVEHLGYPRLDGYVVQRRDKCRPQPWAAAGFLFASGKLLAEVPFDPNLDYVFDGEEILYSARMWTHGWDIFSPSQNILYHYYYRPGAPKFWGGLPPNWVSVRDAAQRRIQRLLKTVHRGTDKRHVPDDSAEEAVIKDLDKFGLGTERTLDQWYAYAGIDRKNYKLTRNFCQENP